MKIYLLSQTENNEYDSYDSCVVCAENEDDAKTIAPDGGYYPKWSKYNWVTSPDLVQCKEIGIANDDQVRGIICASYNAG
jgi:hypothetical protein